MNFDFLFMELSNGLLTIDVPVDSPFIRFALGFWLYMFLINFVLGILKRIPFV